VALGVKYLVLVVWEMVLEELQFVKTGKLFLKNR
jgi:hypothetical protein